MAKIPVRFKRVAAAFDAAARVKPCESSGSEHSSDSTSMTDLFDLVNSFIERNHQRDEEIKEETMKQGMDTNDVVELDNEIFVSDCETKDTLQSLVGCYNDDDDVKTKIRDQTELVCKLIGNSSAQGFKRRLMIQLRERSFDAGLCKSKWEKTSKYPAGNYEYIDINVSGTRYIVQIFLAGEFEIARPTSRYTSLLGVLPHVFVGKLEELKQVVRLMCTAMRKSLKKSDLQIPPWRRNGYMQAKWFGSYKRTINPFPAKSVPEPNEASTKKRSIGFATSTTVSYYCRGDFASKGGLKVGYLAAAFKGDGLQL